MRVDLRAGSPRPLAQLRRALNEIWTILGVERFWLEQVASELAANALAVSPDGAVVEVKVEVATEGFVEVVVVDEGPGPPPLPATLPPPQAHCGRGLYLVQELSDAFWFERLDGRTIARCRRALSPP